MDSDKIKVALKRDFGRGSGDLWKELQVMIDAIGVVGDWGVECDLC